MIMACIYWESTHKSKLFIPICSQGTYFILSLSAGLGFFINILTKWTPFLPSPIVQWKQLNLYWAATLYLPFTSQLLMSRQTSANYWRDYLRATFIEQKLVPFPRWLHSKCSEVIWLPTQIKIFSFHIRSHCDCQKTKCMRICYNFASYKVVWIPDCEKLCLNPGPICLKVD